VQISYGPKKRDDMHNRRGLDFDDAVHVFAGPAFEAEDCRTGYGETRIICFGMLADRIVVVGDTPRGGARHVFSMRKADAREQARNAPLLGL
jgi:hypothetical protein